MMFVKQHPTVQESVNDILHVLTELKVETDKTKHLLKLNGHAVAKKNHKK